MNAKMSLRANRKASLNVDSKIMNKTTCYKCKKIVELKNTILCSICKNRYEFDCAGVSEKLHQLKTPESRKRWKCKLCIRITDTTSNDQSHVTFRKKQKSPNKLATISQSTPLSTSRHEVIAHNSQIVVSPQLSSVLSQSSTILNPHCNSTDTDDTQAMNHISSEDNTPEVSFTLPTPTTLTTTFLSKSLDDSINHSMLLQEMKETISQLTIDLSTTQNELENTILENNDLHRQVNKLNIEIKLLQTLCQSSTENDSGNTTRAKKRHSISEPKNLSTPSSDARAVIWTKSLESDARALLMQRKIMELEQQLMETAGEIEKLLKKVDDLTKNENNGTEIKVNKRNIYIIGTQQCVGLASKLAKSRLSTKYENYNIFSVTKPFATSSDILKTCVNLNVSKKDHVVICTGENDSNPTSLIFELSAALKGLEDANVIILSVMENMFLNEWKLNSTVNQISKQLKYCTFINYGNRYVGKDRYLSMICKKINLIVDSTDYDTKYIPQVNRHCYKQAKCADSNIPPYFSSQTRALKLKSRIADKGTIPYYFQTSNKFKESNLKSNDKLTFFRS